MQSQLADLVRKGKRDEMPKLISDEVLDAFSVRGAYDDIADSIRAKYESVVQRVGFYIPVIGSHAEDRWGEIVRDLSSA